VSISAIGTSALTSVIPPTASVPPVQHSSTNGAGRPTQNGTPHPVNGSAANGSPVNGGAVNKGAVNKSAVNGSAVNAGAVNRAVEPVEPDEDTVRRPAPTPRVLAPEQEPLGPPCDEVGVRVALEGEAS